MRGGEAAAEVVRGWIAKAEGDLANAELVLAAGPGGPMDTVAFHAQQGAEKYLKALLCARREEVPRTHDLDALLHRSGLWDALEVAVEDVRLLSDYATVTRYPGDYEPVTPAEAAEAIDLAQRIRATVLARLPEGLAG